MNFKPAASLAMAHVQLGSVYLQSHFPALSTSPLLNRYKYEIVFVPTLQGTKQVMHLIVSLPDTVGALSRLPAVSGVTIGAKSTFTTGATINPCPLAVSLFKGK